MIEQRLITDRDEWLAWRRQDVTASEVGALAGVDPHRSPLAVHAQKVGLTGAPDETAIMRRGRWLEPAVLKALGEVMPGWQIMPAAIYVRDPAIRLGATPDAFALDPARAEGIVQCKTVARPTFEREWQILQTSDGERPYMLVRAPLRYELQALCEAMLTDTPWAIVAALVIDTFGAELAIADVPRHDGAEARLRQLAEEFWANVKADKLPPTDYQRDAQLIRALYPKGGDGTIDLAGHNRIAALAEEWLGWGKRKRVAEGALDVLGAEICDVLGNHDTGEHPDFNITWKLQHRKEALIPATSFRVLRITRRGRKAAEAEEDR